MFNKIIALLASVSLVASQAISATEGLVSAATTYRLNGKTISREEYLKFIKRMQRGN
jgi:hypothetical protein